VNGKWSIVNRQWTIGNKPKLNLPIANCQLLIGFPGLASLKLREGAVTGNREPATIKKAGERTPALLVLNRPLFNILI